MASRTSPTFHRTHLKFTSLPPVDYWRGILVSLDTFDQGVFQGLIHFVDTKAQALTLNKPFLDGKPYEARFDGRAVIKAESISKLKILCMPEEENEDCGLSVVRCEEYSVDEEHCHYEGYGGYGYGWNRRGEARKTGRYYDDSSRGENGGYVARSLLKLGFCRASRKNNGSGPDDSGTNWSYGRRRFGGWDRRRWASEGDGDRIDPRHLKKDGWKRRQLAKDDDCFGVAVDGSLKEEFDFEKNLAMFDKQAVLEEISSRVDPRASKRKTYRHDENVLRNVNDENYCGWRKDLKDKFAGGEKSAFSKPEPSKSKANAKTANK